MRISIKRPEPTEVVITLSYTEAQKLLDIAQFGKLCQSAYYPEVRDSSYNLVNALKDYGIKQAPLSGVERSL